MGQEAGNQLRQIHMNRGHKQDLDPTYNGDSVGKWDGETLVIDTIGFNDVTWLDHVGLPHTEALHVVERIRRVNHDTLVDDFTEVQLVLIELPAGMIKRCFSNPVSERE